MSETPRWLLVSDVDDTLLGDDSALQTLAQAFRAASHLTVVYNSSRPCASLRRTLAENPYLPTPDYLIGALGTEIQAGKSGQVLTDYTRHLNQGWQLDRITAIMEGMDFVAHPPQYQTPLKVSYDVPGIDAYHQIIKELRRAEISAKVIYSGGKNLDIIPAKAGKGNVINYLHQILQIDPEHVAVAGDSGNDLEMFVAPYRGIVVANADAELKQKQAGHIYHAQLRYAAGVLEGLRYWQFL